MKICNYHKFDDGQGLNGNVGPNTGFNNPSVNSSIAIVAIPANAELKDGKFYDKNTGEYLGLFIFDNSEPRMAADGKYEQYPLNWDKDGLGVRNAAITQLPGVSLQAIGEIYDPKIPSIALSTMQVAAIRDTNPKFGLGDEVLVMSGGKMVSMKFFDYANDRANPANNRLSHAEFNYAGFAAFGLDKTSTGKQVLTDGSAPSAPVMIAAKPVVSGQQYFGDKYPDKLRNSYIGHNNPDDHARGRGVTIQTK